MRNNDMKKLLIIPALLALGLANTSEAQVFDASYRTTNDFKLSTSLGLFSDRVFRGQNLYNGVSFQPDARGSLKTDWGSLYGEFFSHIGADQGDPKASSVPPFDVSDSDGNSAKAALVTPGFNEYDFDIGTTFDLFEGNGSEFAVGHKWYFYDESSDRLVDTAELYGELRFDLPFHPQILAAYDYDEHEGTYLEGSIHQPIPISSIGENAAIIPQITFGMSSGLDGGDRPIYEDSGAAFLDFALKGNFPINTGFAFVPELHFNDGIDDAATSDIWFGMALRGDFGAE